MEIEAYNGNPIVKDSDDYRELKHKAMEIDPNLYRIKIRPDIIMLERNSRKTFRFGSTPTMDWVLSKIKYMKDKNL